MTAVGVYGCYGLAAYGDVRCIKVESNRSAPLSCMSGGRLSGAFKGCARGWGVVLNVSQNASGWMLKKGYAVNGVARIKHYEGVTAPCDAGGKGCSRVQVSSSCKSCELLTVCTLPHSVN